MAHDVFISYASEDKTTADAACAWLEGRGVRCWIAPRDVCPGIIYGAAIVDAITSCRAMVVVLSTHSNASTFVLGEVERAIAKEIPIIPFLIEKVTLSKSMEFFISQRHWLDALSPPLEEHLSRLSEVIQALLKTGAGAEQAQGVALSSRIANASASGPPQGRFQSTRAQMVGGVHVSSVEKQKMKVRLRRVMTGEEFLCEVPSSAKVGPLKEVLIQELGIPRQMANGMPVFYVLHHDSTGRDLDDSRTLTENGVQESDVLTLRAEVCAG